MQERAESSVGPYIIERPIGEGGQGQVYRATHRQTRKPVALKIIELGWDSEIAEQYERRLVREVEALQSIRHRAVVSILDKGRDDEPSVRSKLGRLYIAYDLIDGITMRQYLLEGGGRREAIARMVLGLATGLCKVHQAKVIHRDVKPENVMLRHRDWAKPVLIDFGTVKPNGASTLTMTGRAVGTHTYMAPEVIADPDRASAASDQWSFAHLVAEALAFVSGAGNERIAGRRAPELLQLQELQDLPSTTKALIRALEAAPELRYPSLDRMAHALHGGLVGDGIIEEARPKERAGPAASFRKGKLAERLVARGLETVDMRAKGGALWVLGGPELREVLKDYKRGGISVFRFAPDGAKCTLGEPAWYAKAQDCRGV